MSWFCSNGLLPTIWTALSFFFFLREPLTLIRFRYIDKVYAFMCVQLLNE